MITDRGKNSFWVPNKSVFSSLLRSSAANFHASDDYYCGVDRNSCEQGVQAYYLGLDKLDRFAREQILLQSSSTANLNVEFLSQVVMNLPNYFISLHCFFFPNSISVRRNFLLTQKIFFARFDSEFFFGKIKWRRNKNRSNCLFF